MKASKLLTACMIFLFSFSLVYAANHIVISELLYDPGGPTDQGYEFIELYNPTNKTVNISKWKVQSGGNSWKTTATLPDEQYILPYGFYLIGENQTLIGVGLDYETDLDFQNGGNGKGPSDGVRILNFTDGIIDTLLYDIFNLNLFTTDGDPAPDVTQGHSLERKPGYLIPNCGNWQDTDNNSNDFLDNSNPEPQNSQNATEGPCEGECTIDGDCDDNLYCNGQEECVDSFCQSGIAVDCDDNVYCTVDSCNEGTDSCDNAAEDSLCDDDAVCADYYCDVELDCQVAYEPDTTECRAATSGCDIAEFCTGASADCPPDALAPTGTECGQSRDCPADQCNGFFAEFYPEEGHDTCDGDGNCIEYSCSLEYSYCTDNDANDSINTLECGAECDEDKDCGEGYGCDLSICGCVLIEAICGDNVRNGEEICDGSDLDGKTCQDFNYSDPNGLGCSVDCLGFGTTGCSAVCGNNAVEPGEECDDGNLVGGDGCSSSCKIETELYLAPYVGDIDGDIDSDWFFFFDQLRQWHDENNIPVAFSFYPTTIKNNTQFNQIIADMYLSKNIELIHKGESGGGKGLHNMSYEDVKALLESDQNHFISKMQEILGINDIHLPVSYNQLYGKFTNTIRDVIHELGFKIYFEQYVSEYGYIEALPDLDIMQYSVSFTASGQAGPSEAFKQPDDIFREILSFEHSYMLYINGTKVVSLLSHQQDFLISENSSIIDQQKWGIYTTVLLMAKNDTRIHLLKPEEIYDLRHLSNKSICGNGLLEAGEECDDGNLVGGDGCSLTCQIEEITIIDDLQVNYLKGGIRIDGIIAPAGTNYNVEVLSGDNIGQIYEAGVDDKNVPLFLHGNGFFDTNDQVTFSTGDSFRITSEDCGGSYEGEFLNGGNGDFNDEDSLIQFNCFVPPIIHTIYHSPAEPTEIDDIHISANVTDNFGVDAAIVNYSINSSNVDLMEMDCNEICSANLGAFGFGSVIEYNIAAKDTYGNYVVSDRYTIIVGAADRDGDNYKSDIDCDDNNAGINPGAIEICDGLDNDCDSLIDEHLGQTTCGAGMCEHTIDNCFNGELQICDPFEGAAMEICDGLDNDCDGVIEDDGIDEAWYNQPTNCGVGECSSTGVYTCENGLQIDTCLAGTPTDEICDGLDNDCDSLVDEGFTDTDNDNESDCVDEDDDNDGILDEDDDYPLDPDKFAIMDVSGDGVVNTLDLILTRRQFGKTPNDPDWNGIYDVSRDKRINTLDLILIRRAFT